MDVHNRPYLSAIFNDIGDHINANSVFERGEQDPFRKIIARIDAAAGRSRRAGFARILTKLEPLFLDERYREVNLTNLWTDSPPTVELRLFGNQAEPRDLYDQARLLGRYLRHLDGIRGPIPLRVFSERDWCDLRTPARSEAELKAFVEELGLDWSDYRRFHGRRFPGPIRSGRRDASGRAPIEVRLYDWLNNGGELAYEVRVRERYQKRTISSVRINEQPLRLAGLPGAEGVRIGRLLLAESETVRLRAFDPRGREITTLRRVWTHDQIDAAGWKGASFLAPTRSPLGWAGREAVHAGRFIGAYLLKEAMVAAETRDRRRMFDAALQVKEPGFLLGLGAFTAAARGTEAALRALPSRRAGVLLGKAGLPLAVGMSGVQALSGSFTGTGLAVSFASFMTASTAIESLSAGLLRPAVLALLGPGRFVGGAMSLTQLALTLYAGEKLEGWLLSFLGRRRGPSAVPARPDGVAQGVRALDPARD